MLEKIIDPKMGPIRAKNGPKWGFGHFLGKYAFVFGDFAYYDCGLWYLVASGGQRADKKIVGPKMGPIRAKKGPKWGFRPFSCSKFIRSCRFCILWSRITISSIWWGVKVLKIISLALKWAHFSPNWALKWVFGKYLNFGSFDMFDIVYSDYFQ